MTLIRRREITRGELTVVVRSHLSQKLRKFCSKRTKRQLMKTYCPGLMVNKSAATRIHPRLFQWDISIIDLPESFENVAFSAGVPEWNKKHHLVPIPKIHLANSDYLFERSTTSCCNLFAAVSWPFLFSSYSHKLRIRTTKILLQWNRCRTFFCSVQLCIL